MELKRLPIIIIGLPIVALVLIFGNKYLVDIVVSVVAIMTVYEYYNSFKEEDNKALRWVRLFISISNSVHTYNS